MDNSTITVEQLLTKVRSMLIEQLGYAEQELPNIVVSDMMPGNQVAVGPLYYAATNTLFVPLHGVQSICNMPTLASVFEPTLPKIRAQLPMPRAMSDAELLWLLAHEMAHFKNRDALVQFDRRNLKIGKTIDALALGVQMLGGLIAYFAVTSLVPAEYAQVVGFGGAFLGAITTRLALVKWYTDLFKRRRCAFMVPEEASADHFAIALCTQRLSAEQAAAACQAAAIYFEELYAVDQAAQQAILACAQEQLAASSNPVEKQQVAAFINRYKDAVAAHVDYHIPLAERTALLREHAESIPSGKKHND